MSNSVCDASNQEDSCSWLPNPNPNPVHVVCVCVSGDVRLFPGGRRSCGGLWVAQCETDVCRPRLTLRHCHSRLSPLTQQETSK